MCVRVIGVCVRVRVARKCCAWQHRGGGPRNALGHRPEPEVLPLPAETSREARKCCAWQHPEPEVLPLPAETSREAPARKCCAWQHRGGGPRNALGHRPEAHKCCAWQHRGGGPETRSGTVQSLKCCPCQQKRAARLQGSKVLRLAASRGGAPKRARAPSRA